MDSEQLEAKLRYDRARFIDSVRMLNKEYSPVELLDRHYFHGQGRSLADSIFQLKEDPIPGLLIGAALMWCLDDGSGFTGDAQLGCPPLSQ